MSADFNHVHVFSSVGSSRSIWTHQPAALSCNLLPTMKYNSASVQSPLPESRAPSTARSTFAIQVDTDTVGEGLYGVSSRSFAFFRCSRRYPERDERRRRCRRPCRRRRRPARVSSSLSELPELLELLSPLPPGEEGCRAGTLIIVRLAVLDASCAAEGRACSCVTCSAAAAVVVPAVAGAIVPVPVAVVSVRLVPPVGVARGVASVVLVVLGRAVAVAPGGVVAADRSSSMPPTRASKRATDAIIRWMALTSVVISAFVAAGALPGSPLLSRPSWWQAWVD
jgi:hypothetical protein